MRNEKPRLNLEEFSQRQKLSDLENDKDALYRRTNFLIEEMHSGNIPKEVIVFETLLSAFYFFEGGYSHEDIADAYPVKEWRDETVTLPRALVRPLVESWLKYKDADTGKTFGEVFNLEGGGQGKKRAKSKVDIIDKQKKLSSLVFAEYLADGIFGRPSWERAIASVAEKNDISESAVRMASEKFRPESTERFDAHGWLE